MPQALYRQQVLTAQRTAVGQFADVAVPLTWRWVSVATAVLLAGICSLLIFGSYTPRQVAPGYLQTLAPGSRVIAAMSGRIETLYVRHGEFVRKGQLLAAVIREHTLKSGNNVERDYLSALARESDAVAEQLAIVDDLLESERMTLEENQRMTRAQLDVLASQVDTESQRLKLAKRRAERLRKLRVAGSVPQQSVDDADSEVMTRQLSLQSLKLQRMRSETELRAAERTQDALSLRAAERRAELRAELQRLRQRTADAAGRHVRKITAPVDGYISLMEVAAGQEVGATTPLFTVTPSVTTSADLYAVVYVSSRAAGKLLPGGEVRLRLDAFPYQRYGARRGEIVTVASQPSLPADVQYIALREPAYRLRVRLQRHASLPKLRAGMTLQADVLGAPRRIVSWLLDPLAFATDVVDRS